MIFVQVGGVPENHRSVSKEVGFSVVESLAFGVEKGGLNLLVYGSTDSRVRKSLR